VSYYRNTDMLDAEVYHVGHHGSYNGTNRALLEAVRPQVAVIGVGQWDYGKGGHNPFTTYFFGHPRQVTIDLLSEFIVDARPHSVETSIFEAARQPIDYTIDKRIYATGWDGDVTIEAALNGDLSVTTHPDGSPTPIAEGVVVHRRVTQPPNLVAVRRRQTVGTPPFDSVDEDSPSPPPDRSPGAHRSTRVRSRPD
jgi:hypothetical protein